MSEHRRASDNITEPQTLDEFVRAIYARQSQVIEKVEKIDKTVFGNGKAGLCDRLITVETTIKVIGAIIVVGAGYIALFK